MLGVARRYNKHVYSSLWGQYHEARLQLSGQGSSTFHLKYMVFIPWSGFKDDTYFLKKIKISTNIDIMCIVRCTNFKS